MKLRKSVSIDSLEEYGYRYESNLIYPTYQKIINYGNRAIIIDVMIKNRMVYVNKSPVITKRNVHFIRDLIINNLVEK
ncbi:MAG: hypothetical protein U0M66_00890 [Bacilli bacterium]|nr:hypothetical protein [Bacilli bacterium]